MDSWTELPGAKQAQYPQIVSLNNIGIANAYRRRKEIVRRRREKSHSDAKKIFSGATRSEFKVTN